MTVSPLPAGPKSSDLGPWQRIALDTSLDVALWVQLKTQLQYLITTGEVAEGTQLPSVRAFAAHLGIAVETVRKAYDEARRNDLVRTVHGVGSFTSLPNEPDAFGDTDLDPWGRADEALTDLARSGVDIAANLRILRQRLAVVENGVRAVFFGTEPAAARYAAQIAQRLQPLGIPVVAANIDSLRSDDVEVPELTHAISLPLHRLTVEKQLGDRPVRCLTLVAKLAPGLARQIPVVDPHDTVVLVARPETAMTYINALAADRPDLATPVLVRDNDEKSLSELAPTAAAILHTTVATDLVHRVVTDKKKIVELRHVPDPQSLDASVAQLTADHDLRATLLRASAMRDVLPIKPLDGGQHRRNKQ